MGKYKGHNQQLKRFIVKRAVSACEEGCHTGTEDIKPFLIEMLTKTMANLICIAQACIEYYITHDEAK